MKTPPCFKNALSASKAVHAPFKDVQTVGIPFNSSPGDEFQSIYLTVAAKPSYAKVDLVIAMSVAMAYIKKSRGTYSAVEYSFDTEDKLNGNCMG